MRVLRDPADGCPWDRAQTFRTIAPYTIEEAYEVADAIEQEQLAALCGELGDLLFQVIFHAQMAEEQGLFDFQDVVRSICEKLTRRHPHVFSPSDGQRDTDPAKAWEAIKHQERLADGDDSGVLRGIASSIPALVRASKLGNRAARVGFDWPDISGARSKVSEELAEVDDALLQGDPAHTEAELGDLLFAVSNLCRHASIDPEQALRGANSRFQARFEDVERAVDGSGRPWEKFTLEQLDQLWEDAKARLASRRAPR